MQLHSALTNRASQVKVVEVKPDVFPSYKYSCTVTLVRSYTVGTVISGLRLLSWLLLNWLTETCFVFNVGKCMPCMSSVDLSTLTVICCSHVKSWIIFIPALSPSPISAGGEIWWFLSWMCAVSVVSGIWPRTFGCQLKYFVQSDKAIM